MIDPKELRKGNAVVLAHESNAPIVYITEIRTLGVYAEYAPGDGSSYYLFDRLLPIEVNERELWSIQVANNTSLYYEPNSGGNDWYCSVSDSSPPY